MLFVTWRVRQQSFVLVLPGISDADCNDQRIFVAAHQGGGRAHFTRPGALWLLCSDECTEANLSSNHQCGGQAVQDELGLLAFDERGRCQGKSHGSPSALSAG